MTVAERIRIRQNKIGRRSSIRKLIELGLYAAGIAVFCRWNTRPDAAESYEPTAAFTDLSEKQPWLAPLRKTVGQTMVDTSDGDYFGSAVLLDRYGTIALSAHQYHRDNMKLKFFLQDGPVVLDVHDFQRDSKHDLMFASISPLDIQQFGLMPISWGRMGFEKKEKGQDIIALGFPGSAHHLHAAEGTVSSFVPSVETDGGTKFCEIESRQVIFLGMSGSGVFHAGKFVGIVTSKTTVETFFVPVDLVKAAYCELYPDRARHTNIAPPKTAARPQTPAACKIGRRDFLSFLSPR